MWVGIRPDGNTRKVDIRSPDCQLEHGEILACLEALRDGGIGVSFTSEKATKVVATLSSVDESSRKFKVEVVGANVPDMFSCLERSRRWFEFAMGSGEVSARVKVNSDRDATHVSFTNERGASTLSVTMTIGQGVRWVAEVVGADVPGMLQHFELAQSWLKVASEE